jgi:putative nucleotide binding protein
VSNLSAKDKKKFEEYTYILDFLPRGYLREDRPQFMGKPIAQAIGEDFFMLLELVPKSNVSLSPGERIFIGKGFREKIERITRRLSYDELTAFAKDELPRTVERIVREHENRFVQFLNNAPPLTTKMHSLELLPRIGKKTMWVIIKEREKAPFTSYEDFEKRTGVNNIVSIMMERILAELKGNERYYLFTVPPVFKEKTTGP